MTERFIVSEAKDGKVDAYLESNPSIAVVRVAEPLHVGARLLLSKGFSPTALLTSRWQHLGYDSFVPKEIGTLAKYTIIEGDKGIRTQPFREFPKHLRRSN